MRESLEEAWRGYGGQPKSSDPLHFRLLIYWFRGSQGLPDDRFTEGHISYSRGNTVVSRER